MEYTENQQRAIKAIADCWQVEGRGALVTVAGYAGTGKTTIVREAIRTIEKRQHGEVGVKYACYTGKAAMVLQKKLTGAEVCTMHRLLYNSYPMDYFKNDDDGDKARMLDMDGVIKTKDFAHVPKRSLDCDIVVIDEASMVPLPLWSTLRKHRVMLICLGDPAQLPPVEDKDADVNGEVEQRPVFPMVDDRDAYDVFLDEIMRQNADSGIIQLSMIARTLPPICDRQSQSYWCPPHVGSVHKDYTIEGRLHAPEILNDYIQDLRRDGTDTSKRVMLCYRNSSRIAINKYIHKALGYTTDEIEPGERVVCLRNYNQLCGSKGSMVVNGLMGICVGVRWNEALNGNVIDIDSDGELFTDIPASKADWAYCLTVHKSQGSEWENVLLLDEWYELWLESYGQWLYTGITRAQKFLTVLKCKVSELGVPVEEKKDKQLTLDMK